ncbi:MAG TPA: glycerol-3-phosphate dehydrogenase [Thermomicrobiales bacterium]|nr:glycerol-3-phosphate dehydrogenase [Thermomicrobiales bacterium]
MSRELPNDGQRFDLIVVGAGVNGTGIARDAAMRGLRVLLLDKGDLASGTTSWSSRLIHGGLRYLEHREFGLVRESLRERERLLHVAPHLVEPLPLLIPIYRGDRRGPLLIRVGMVAYDILSFDKSLPRHRMLSRDAALRRAPGLRRDGLRGAAVYYDAQIAFAERLAVENALDARDHGAAIVTYARADRLLTDAGDQTVRGVAYTDLVNGGTRDALAPVTLNVAGPWVDRLLTDKAGTRSEPMIGGTKGSHIIVEPFPGAPRDALYVEAERDGRPYFIIPWNDLYLIGTTDERYHGDLDRVVATEEEIQYLIDETNRTIPSAGLTRASVCYTYSGVRPLPYQAKGAEGAITRRHIVHDHAPELQGLLSIVGGKLTTYRNLAEQAVDAVFKRLGRHAPPSPTARIPVPGGRLPGDGEVAARRNIFIAELGRTNVSPRTAERLFHIYGVRAAAILRLAEREPALWTPLRVETDAIQAEVVFAVQDELALTLSDILLRRTMIGLGPDVGVGADEAVACVAHRFLGWDDNRVRDEIAGYREYIERFTPRAIPHVSSERPSL